MQGEIWCAGRPYILGNARTFDSPALSTVVPEVKLCPSCLGVKVWIGTAGGLGLCPVTGVGLSLAAVGNPVDSPGTRVPCGLLPGSTPDPKLNGLWAPPGLTPTCCPGVS